MNDVDSQQSLSETFAVSLKGRWAKPVWCGTNAVVMAIHVWLSKPLWAYHMEPGTMHSSGPGDGLYFFFLLMIPWLLVMLVNVVILIRAVIKRATWGTGWIWVQLAILLAWLIIAVVEQRLLQVPEGGIKIGS